MFEDIEFEIESGRARISINRPEKHNAMSLRTQAEIAEALWEADADKRVHSIILKGAGASFCAGYDLASYGSDVPLSRLESADDKGMKRRHREIDDDIWQLERAQRYRMAAFEIHKPVIAQIHGYCLAGGTDLALLCDILVASDDAVIGFPPVRDLGSPPNQMWVYNVGPQWAKRLLLTGDTISGQDAQKIGLVLKSVPAHLLEKEVEFLADRFARIDPDILSVNKRSVNLALELMGAKTMQRLAAELDARGHKAQSADTFRKTVKEHGLKSALQKRDEVFGNSRVRVDVPDADG